LLVLTGLGQFLAGGSYCQCVRGKRVDGEAVSGVRAAPNKTRARLSQLTLFPLCLELAAAAAAASVRTAAAASVRAASSVCAAAAASVRGASSVRAAAAASAWR
jgi:hypothetical protein